MAYPIIQIYEFPHRGRQPRREYAGCSWGRPVVLLVNLTNIYEEYTAAVFELVALEENPLKGGVSLDRLKEPRKKSLGTLEEVDLIQEIDTLVRDEEESSN